MAKWEPIPPDAFLSGYSPSIRDVAERLRDVVCEAVPEAIERVRVGWRLIGYDVPVGRRTRYFAFVAPEPEHVHLGFEYGIWMDDPDGLLRGAHLDLRRGPLRHLPARRPGPGRALGPLHARGGRYRSAWLAFAMTLMAGRRNASAATQGALARADSLHS